MWPGLDSDNVALIAVFGLTDGNLVVVEVVNKVSSTHDGVTPKIAAI